MRIRVCIEVETKDVPFEKIKEEFELPDSVTEKNFDSMASVVSEHLTKGMFSSRRALEEIEVGKVIVSRMGR